MFIATKEGFWFNIETIKPFYYPDTITTVWHGDFIGTIYAIGDQVAWDYTQFVVTERKMRNLNAVVSVLADCPTDLSWVLPFYDEDKDFGGLFFVHKKDNIITSRVIWLNDAAPLQIITGCDVITSRYKKDRVAATEYLINKGVSKKDITSMRFALVDFNRKGNEIIDPIIMPLITERFFDEFYPHAR